MSLETTAAPHEAPADDAGRSGSPASAAGDLRTSQTRGANRLAFVCVLAAILPIVVATVRAIARHWVPVGDNPYFAIRARDVFTDHHPLLGTWTSASQTVGIDINNPGPLLYDALALPVKVIGGHAGLAIGVALINIASVVGIALVARRQAGPRAVVAAMAAAAALGWAMGSELLFDPWQPHSLLLPVLCFLMMVWALACGDVALLAWAVGVASFIVQTHIGYALLVPALGAWGVGAAGLRLWRLRRSDAAAWPRWRRRARTSVGAAAVVGIVCWSQPLYEQLFVEGRGNLGRLASSITKTQDKVGPELAPRFVAEIVALPPWWGRPSSSVAFAPGASPSPMIASIVGLVLVAALLLAGAVVGRRRADSAGVSAAVTGLFALGLAVVAATTMPVGTLGVAAHHLRWLWPLAVFVTFAVAMPLVTAPGRGRAAQAGMVVLAVATLLLSALNLPTMNARLGPSADADAIPTVRALLPQLESLRHERSVLFEVHGLRFAEPYSVPVMAELQRLGVPWYVDDPGMVRQLGTERAYSGGGSVRLVLREGDGAREIPPGTRRVAYVDGLTDDEAAELEDVKARLAPFIAGGGLVLNDRQQAPHPADDFDARPLSPAQLRDPDYLLSVGTASSRFARALVYLVVADRLEAPPRWSAPLQRYADLQQQADRLTVAVFAEPLESDR